MSGWSAAAVQLRADSGEAPAPAKPSRRSRFASDGSAAPQKRGGAGWAAAAKALQADEVPAAEPAPATPEPAPSPVSDPSASAPTPTAAAEPAADPAPDAPKASRWAQAARELTQHSDPLPEAGHAQEELAPAPAGWPWPVEAGPMMVLWCPDWIDGDPSGPAAEQCPRGVACEWGHCRVDVVEQFESPRPTELRLGLRCLATASRLLVLGEANFSLSSALVNCGVCQGTSMVCTSLNSLETHVGSFTDTAEHIEQVTSSGGVVLGMVNARDIVNSLWEASGGALVAKYDCVAFTLPHVGTDDDAANAHLMSDFLLSARHVLARNGVVLVALIGEQFRAWKVPQSVAQHGYVIAEQIPFQSQVMRHLPGYVPHSGFSGRAIFAPGPSSIMYVLRVAEEVGPPPPPPPPPPWAVGRRRRLPEDEEELDMEYEEPSPRSHSGILVKWLDDKGFGFITRPEGSDIFVHHSQLTENQRRGLRVGCRINFDLIPGVLGRQEMASRCLFPPPGWTPPAPSPVCTPSPPSPRRPVPPPKPARRVAADPAMTGRWVRKPSA